MNCMQVATCKNVWELSVHCSHLDLFLVDVTCVVGLTPCSRGATQIRGYSWWCVQESVRGVRPQKEVQWDPVLNSPLFLDPLLIKCISSSCFHHCCMLSVFCLMSNWNHRFLILTCTISCKPVVFYWYHRTIHCRSRLFLRGTQLQLELKPTQSSNFLSSQW